MDKLTTSQIKKRCQRLRVDIIEMLTEAGSGHPGGSLSCVEIIATLFYRHLRCRPQEPAWDGRDRFVLSKGHGVPTLYAVMADLGYFPHEKLKTLRKMGSELQGHPSNTWMPAVEASTGSLGQGLSVAQGMAMGARLNQADSRIYCMTGDGECQEGQIWEAAMSAPRWKLDNLCAIVDYNKGQIDGFVKDIMDLEPLADKFRAFNWHVLEVDGHDVEALDRALDEARAVKEKPTVIIAHTIKGKGVSFMENNMAWHGNAPKAEDAERALQELRRDLPESA